MRPIALRWRIRLLVTLVVAALVTAVSATSYLRFRTAYLGHIDRLLKVMSKGILTELDEPQDPQELADKVRLITDSPWRGPETHFRLWVEGEGTDLIASVPAGGRKARFLWNLQHVEPPEGNEPVFFSLTDKKKHFRALWTRHATPRGNVNVLIAHPSSFKHRRLDELLVTLLVVGGGSSSKYLPSGPRRRPRSSFRRRRASPPPPRLSPPTPSLCVAWQSCLISFRLALLLKHPPATAAGGPTERAPQVNPGRTGPASPGRSYPTPAPSCCSELDGRQAARDL